MRLNRVFRRRLVVALAALCWGAVTWLTLTPKPPELPAADDWPIPADKLAHAVAWGALTVTAWWLLRAVTSWSRGVRVVVVWMAAVGYGGAIEWGQGLSGARTPDLMDFLADLAGVMVALWLMVWWERRCARANPDTNPGANRSSGPERSPSGR